MGLGEIRGGLGARGGGRRLKGAFRARPVGRGRHTGCGCVQSWGCGACRVLGQPRLQSSATVLVREATGAVPWAASCEAGHGLRAVRLPPCHCPGDCTAGHEQAGAHPAAAGPGLRSPTQGEAAHVQPLPDLAAAGEDPTRQRLGDRGGLSRFPGRELCPRSLTGLFGCPRVLPAHLHASNCLETRPGRAATAWL